MQVAMVNLTASEAQEIAEMFEEKAAQETVWGIKWPLFVKAARFRRLQAILIGGE